MPFLQAVLLDCFSNLNGERTPYAVFHLLNGKKISTDDPGFPFFQDWQALSNVSIYFS